MSCTRIIVYNLPEEARNRLGSISEAALDVYPDFSIRQSKQSEELNSEGKIVLDGSYRDWETDRKSTRLNSSHRSLSRMPSSA